jgi:hypothetical protein
MSQPTNVQEIITALTAGEITQAEATKLLGMLVAKKPTKRPPGISFSTTDKGCVSVLGLRSHWGFYFYPNEWEILKAHSAAIDAFIADPANKEKLSFKKGDKDAPTPEATLPQAA